MSIFEGIESVEVSEKLPYLSVGVYPELEIERVSAGNSFAGEAFFKIQVKVVKSEGPNASPAGSSAVRVIKKDKYKYYLKDIKAFAAALINEPAKNVTEAMLTEMTSPANPTKGHKICAQVSPKENSTFTNVRWTPFDTGNTATTAPSAATKAPAAKGEKRA